MARHLNQRIGTPSVKHVPQVLHLVSQLTDPHLPFHTVMVAVDPRDTTSAPCTTATSPRTSGCAPFIRQYDSPDLQLLLQRLRRLERRRPLNTQAAAAGASEAAAKQGGSDMPAGPIDVGMAAPLSGLSQLPLVDEVWVSDAEGSDAVEQVNARCAFRSGQGHVCVLVEIEKGSRDRLYAARQPRLSVGFGLWCASDLARSFLGALGLMAMPPPRAARNRPLWFPALTHLNAHRRRWFGLAGCRRSHTAEGVPTTPTLQALERMQQVHGCEVVLQCDCDLVVWVEDKASSTNTTTDTSSSNTGSRCVAAAAMGVETPAAGVCAAAAKAERQVGAHTMLTPIPTSYLTHAAGVLLRDPCAVTVSLDPPLLPAPGAFAPSQPHSHGMSTQATGLAAAGSTPAGPTFCGPHGPWRVEVRGCLLHLPRLVALLPLAPLPPQPPQPLAPRPLPCADGRGRVPVGLWGRGVEEVQAGAATQGEEALSTAVPAASALATAETAAADMRSLYPPKWYRSLDAAVTASRGAVRSYRGACGGMLAFVHPQNVPVKCPGQPPAEMQHHDMAAAGGDGASGNGSGGHARTYHGDVLWDLLYSTVPYGRWPGEQIGRVDVVGGVEEWAAAVAGAPTAGGGDGGRRGGSVGDGGGVAAASTPQQLVVAVCGRNVPPGKIGRCIESITRQVRACCCGVSRNRSQE